MRPAAHSELRRVSHGDVGRGSRASARHGAAPWTVVRRRVFAGLRAARGGGVGGGPVAPRLSGVAGTGRRCAADCVRDLFARDPTARVADARMAHPAGQQAARLLRLRRRRIHLRSRVDALHRADSRRHSDARGHADGPGSGDGVAGGVRTRTRYPVPIDGAGAGSIPGLVSTVPPLHSMGGPHRGRHADRVGHPARHR